MAYDNRNGQGQQQRPAYGKQNVVAASNATRSYSEVSTAGAKPSLLTTGLFKPDSDKSKALASIRLKEAVTIPAGSYINLYVVDNVKENGPTHRIQIKEGTVKAK